MIASPSFPGPETHNALGSESRITTKLQLPSFPMQVSIIQGHREVFEDFHHLTACVHHSLASEVAHDGGRVPLAPRIPSPGRASYFPRLGYLSPWVTLRRCTSFQVLSTFCFRLTPRPSPFTGRDLDITNCQMDATPRVHPSSIVSEHIVEERVQVAPRGMKFTRGSVPDRVLNARHSVWRKQ